MKLHLYRWRLNAQGYDSFGAYFGLGAPLYAYESVDGKVSGMIRASSRKEAKRQIRQMTLTKSATFFR